MGLAAILSNSPDAWATAPSRTCIRPAIPISVLALLTGDDDDNAPPLFPHTHPTNSISPEGLRREDQGAGDWGRPTLAHATVCSRQQLSKTPASRVDALRLEELIAGFLRGLESSLVRVRQPRSRPALIFGIPPPTPAWHPTPTRLPTPTGMPCFKSVVAC
ncbi:hypothetical protein C8J57DRAFT_1502944 [Mycena rebaudengoi]|nr:hypothetical protein C8J57DRAFT_1502944 [Mycena rebaudengoi]